MKTALSIFCLFVIVSISACTPQATVQPASLPAVEIIKATTTQAKGGQAADTDTSTDIPVTPANGTQPAAWKPYTNQAFGLSFQYPAGWFGPDEYTADQTLRLVIGSDVVYPYGTDITQQVQTLKNSYYVTIQYTKHNQNAYWQETYQSLTTLKDGESRTSGRSMIIRVKERSAGQFKGFEYISTLSQSAQTEPVYMREVILVDDQSNVLTISGTPSNVALGGAGWREAYQNVDQANVDLYNFIVESVALE